ncbi:toll/interleukin-1 receptor domain-containing protein [Desulfosediminicola flagellatus]|uniref:toll/interleukin-1 receptor domain-containing protein n=1 Tax=Desulfosediminicola flagellatus TaxID=2569541 RepID=UPI0010ABC8B0|nr:toll/interleukin-1 receptor domain-containing protein [Desulfosediminicola flagellatus]
MGNTTCFVVDRETKKDTRLMLFLRDWHTEIYPDGDPAGFVNELNRRWCERNPSHSSEPADTLSSELKALKTMLPGSIFISYSREDLAEVQILHDTLEQAGLDVWFDVNRLGSGDAWERKIQDNIRNCSLFLPIISRNAVERMEGFYRREWRWAKWLSPGRANSRQHALFGCTG